MEPTQRSHQSAISNHFPHFLEAFSVKSRQQSRMSLQISCNGANNGPCKRLPKQLASIAAPNSPSVEPGSGFVIQNAGGTHGTKDIQGKSLPQLKCSRSSLLVIIRVALTAETQQPAVKTMLSLFPFKPSKRLLTGEHNRLGLGVGLAGIATRICPTAISTRLKSDADGHMTGSPEGSGRLSGMNGKSHRWTIQSLHTSGVIPLNESGLRYELTFMRAAIFTSILSLFCGTHPSLKTVRSVITFMTFCQKFREFTQPAPVPTNKSPCVCKRIMIISEQ